MDRAYRKFVRARPCVVRGHAQHECFGRNQACHVKHAGMGGKNAPADRGNLFTACVRAHDEYHRSPATFAAKYGVNVVVDAERAAREYMHGKDFLEEIAQ